MATSETLSPGGKERLASAAAELFHHRGYGEVTVSEILSKSGVQAPTLYYHFGDKEGLFVTWAEQALERFGNAVRQQINPLADVIENLTIFSALLAEKLDLDLLLTLHDAERLERPDSRERVFQAYFKNVQEPLCAALLTGMERGRLRAEPVSRMAAVFLMGALGTSQRCPLPGASVVPDRGWWARRFVDGFKAGT